MCYILHMRLHRFFIKDFGPHAGGTTGGVIHIDPKDKENGDANIALIHQWKDVFRLKEGDAVIVFNPEEGEWTGTLVSIDKKEGARIQLSQKTWTMETLEPFHDIHLYMAVIKNSNFDTVVEKATELGACRIVPLATERTVKTKLNFERLNRIAIEASEQSGRIDPPQIYDRVMDLDSALADVKRLGLQAFYGHVFETSNPELRKEPNAYGDMRGKAALFIGPEGGWTAEEQEVLNAAGVMPITLGQYVLRAETAAIIGVGKLIML